MTTSTTWADIQRLAADLQRVQLAEGSKRELRGGCDDVDVHGIGAVGHHNGWKGIRNSETFGHRMCQRMFGGRRRSINF
uniref:Transketolase n=1 Tax=Globodera pallida TaxID=36090 RepID=A0A183CNI9_GLOPA